MRFLFFLFTLFTVFPASAQHHLQGKVSDAATGEMLAFVNIGIVGGNLGTVSDVSGTFEFTLPESLMRKTLRISLAGYQPLETTVEDFIRKYGEQASVTLKGAPTLLEDVVVRAFPHPASWGNTALGRDKVSAGFVNNVLGNELGLLIKAPEHPARIDAFHALVASNKYKELKFRLNFYSVRNGLPDRNLLSESIIVTSAIKEGKLDVDLAGYGIVVNGDFFVSLEWIEQLGEGGLQFSADYSGPQLITRAASQGRWNKVGDLSFAFWVSVHY